MGVTLPGYMDLDAYDRADTRLRGRGTDRMNDSSDRRAIQEIRIALPETADLQVQPLDLDDACRRYTEDGYEVTAQLRQFLAVYGELTVAWTSGEWTHELTTSVERALESTHATPRTLAVLTKRLGFPVSLVGTAFDTEEAVLLAENGDILLYGDAGFQRVASGFGSAVRALVTGDWDKSYF
ncbi:SUKH-3 domain-containing protein [Streptomyces leeuwenhoekii]|uniref:SUKH-3 immunity protein of toxin-antitoxin system n=1 Tax=Streptomyces leeuwenhoekii TaxID=1437453 RepID=A0A0F7VLE9_STRLW|nr:SUKH-3 domain-containing protein [Streptomyces leeuwenhoekii]CQR60349.1 Hypothetical Protein sle_08860 [Streptomyces leeuwenhoekii]